MPNDQDLFGKTFDQQLQLAGEGVVARDIKPNSRFPVEILFEPWSSGVRITVYDEQDRILFQDVSKNMVEKGITSKRISGEIVFEPMRTGVRVTARDEGHKVLWGYVGLKETVNQVHCLVAVYETLQELIAEELEKRGLLFTESDDPISAATCSLDRLEKNLKLLRDSLKVKVVSEATLERARAIARIVSDADRQITIESGMLKGTTSKAEK